MYVCTLNRYLNFYYRTPTISSLHQDLSICMYVPCVPRYFAFEANPLHVEHVQELSVDDLKELLLENEISNFDPVAEAFKVFDPRGEGSFDGSKLRAAFVSFGFGELSDEEFEILKRVG